MIYEMLSSAFEKNRAERARYFSMLKAAAEQPGGQAAQPPNQPGGQNAQPPNQPGGQGAPPPAAQPPTGQGVQPPGAQPTAGQGVQPPGAQVQTVQMPPAMRPSVMWHQQRAAEEAAKQKARAAARAAGREQLQQLAQNLNSNDPKERENARRQYVEAARNAGYEAAFADYPGVSVDPEKWLNAGKQAADVVLAAKRGSLAGDHSLTMALNKLEEKYRELAYRRHLGTKPPSFHTYLKQLAYEGRLPDALASVGYKDEDNARLTNLLAGPTFGARVESQVAAAEKARIEAERRARARSEPVRVDWSDLYRPTPRRAPADVMPGESDVKNIYGQKPAAQPPQAQAGGFRERRPPPAPGSTTGRSAQEVSMAERFDIVSEVYGGFDTNAWNTLRNVFAGDPYKGLVRDPLNSPTLYEVNTEVALAVKYNRPFDIGPVLRNRGIYASAKQIADLNNAYQKAINNARQRLGYQQAGGPAPQHPGGPMGRSASELSIDEKDHILSNINIATRTRNKVNELIGGSRYVGINPNAREAAENKIRDELRNMVIDAITKGDEFDFNTVVTRYGMQASAEDIDAINYEVRRAVDIAQQRLGIKHEHAAEPESIWIDPSELLPSERKAILNSITLPATIEGLIDVSPYGREQARQRVLNRMLLTITRGDRFDVDKMLTEDIGTGANSRNRAVVAGALAQPLREARSKFLSDRFGDVAEKPYTPTHSSVGKRMDELSDEEYKDILDRVNVPNDITAELNNLISRSEDSGADKELVQTAVNFRIVESVMNGTDFDIKRVLGDVATDEEIARINNAYRKAIADAREELGHAPATPRTRTAGGAPGGTSPRRGEAQPPGGKPTETEPPIWWRRPQAPTPSPADLANRPAKELSEAERTYVLESLAVPEDARSKLGELLARAVENEDGITYDYYNMLINAITRGETFDIGKLASDYGIDTNREEINIINKGFNQAIADARKKLGLVPSAGRETQPPTGQGARPRGGMPFRLLPPDRLLPPKKRRLPPVTLT